MCRWTTMASTSSPIACARCSRTSCASWHRSWFPAWICLPPRSCRRPMWQPGTAPWSSALATSHGGCPSSLARRTPRGRSWPCPWSSSPRYTGRWRTGCGAMERCCRSGSLRPLAAGAGMWRRGSCRSWCTTAATVGRHPGQRFRPRRHRPRRGCLRHTSRRNMFCCRWSDCLPRVAGA